MGQTPISEEHFGKLKSFFDQDVCLRGMKPLRNGIEIALFVDERGPVTLTKRENKPTVLENAPYSADMTFWVPPAAIEVLSKETTNDIGEMGIAILRLMASSDPNLRIRTRVHIGLFEFLRGGYLGVLPLGGTTVMKYLASKGFDGIGKIREAISKLKS